MNLEIKSKWLAVLRSGEYIQGKEALNYDNQQFCCLGVLCELAVKENVIPKAKKGIEEHFRNYGKEKEYSVLPEEVIVWSELSSPNPSIEISLKTIAGLNDSNKSFNEIADLIEQHL